MIENKIVANNGLREELEGELVVAKFATTKRYGRRDYYTQVSETTFYNLDVSRLI